MKRADATVRVIGTDAGRLGEHLRTVLSGAEVTTAETWTGGRGADCVVATDVWRSVLADLDGDRRGPPVVVVTPDDETVKAALDAGASDVVRVTDGATADVLARRVERLLSRTDPAADRTLAALHDATVSLFGAECREAVAGAVIEAAAGVLSFSGAGVRFYDPEREALVSVAVGGDAAVEVDDRPPFDPAETPHGEAYLTGETVVHEVDPATDPYDIGVFERTLYLPLGDHGVLSLGRREAAAFDECDRIYAEILAESARAALDRVERECELRDQKQRLETFADAVSHDLRTPLQIPSGQLELARDGGDEAHLDRVAAAHSRMAQLVESMLTLAQGDDPDTVPDVSTAWVAREAWDAVGTSDAILRIGDDPGTVRAAPDQLGQLFRNLFRNAVEHGRTTTSRAGAESTDQSDPAVTVRVGPIDDAGFYVADDGLGIPPEERERVLEHGYSVDGGTTGFGLAIVRRIVRAHGWSLAVTESRSGGARFEIET